MLVVGNNIARAIAQYRKRSFVRRAILEHRHVTAPQPRFIVSSAVCGTKAWSISKSRDQKLCFSLSLLVCYSCPGIFSMRIFLSIGPPMNALSYHHTSLLQAYPFHYYTVDPSLRVPGTAYVMESPKESSRISMVFVWYIPI